MTRRTQAMADELMSIAEVAKVFRVSSSAVRSRVKRGLLPAPVKGTTKPRQFRRAEIEGLLRAGPHRAAG